MCTWESSGIFWQCRDINVVMAIQRPEILAGLQFTNLNMDNYYNYHIKMDNHNNLLYIIILNFHLFFIYFTIQVG